MRKKQKENKKYIAFKFEISIGKGYNEKDDSDCENIKNKNKSHHDKYEKENQNCVSNYKCYECGEISHIKSNCSNPKKSEEKKDNTFIRRRSLHSLEG